jgi:hypothetical protein
VSCWQSVLLEIWRFDLFSSMKCEMVEGERPRNDNPDALFLLSLSMIRLSNEMSFVMIPFLCYESQYSWRFGSLIVSGSHCTGELKVLHVWQLNTILLPHDFLLFLIDSSSASNFHSNDALIVPWVCHATSYSWSYSSWRSLSTKMVYARYVARKQHWRTPRPVSFPFFDWFLFRNELSL